MAAQVCKEWNRLCSDDIIWREIYRRLRPLFVCVSCVSWFVVVHRLIWDTLGSGGRWMR
jgi:hypothetical protein